MNEPRIHYDPASDSPARRQIFDQIRDVIVEGALHPEAELPSVRRLAVDLGIHFNTVAEAYRLLAQDGWIEIVQGRGARVLNRARPAAPGPQTALHFREQLRRLVAEMRSRGFTAARIAKELSSVSEGLK